MLSLALKTLIPNNSWGTNPALIRKAGRTFGLYTQQTFMGIDISKTQLDAASRSSGSAALFANTDDGIAACVAWVTALTPELIVVEATGGWERALVAARMLAQIPRGFRRRSRRISPGWTNNLP